MKFINRRQMLGGLAASGILSQTDISQAETKPLPDLKTDFQASKPKFVLNSQDQIDKAYQILSNSKEFTARLFFDLVFTARYAKNLCIFNEYCNISPNFKVDFNSFLGDTIREKCDSITFHVIRLIRLLKDLEISNNDEFLWIASSPEVMTIFEVFNNDFESVSSKMFRYQALKLNAGIKIPSFYSGVLSPFSDYKIHLFKNEVKDVDSIPFIQIGCNENYINLQLDNFVI